MVHFTFAYSRSGDERAVLAGNHVEGAYYFERRQPCNVVCLQNYRCPSEKQIKGNRANYYRDQNMTIWFYVKTNDSPTSVGEVVCNFNFIQGEHPEDKYSYIMKKERVKLNTGK